MTINATPNSKNHKPQTTNHKSHNTPPFLFSNSAAAVGSEMCQAQATTKTCLQTLNPKP